MPEALHRLQGLQRLRRLQLKADMYRLTKAGAPSTKQNFTAAGLWQRAMKQRVCHC